MKTAIDTSVLLAIFQGEPGHIDWLDALIGARAQGQLVICEVVYAELAAAFNSQTELDEKLNLLGIVFETISPASAFLAGRTFRRYRDGGGPRARLIPDFLIASHATTQATQLASTDNGFFRQYFKTLKLLNVGV